MSNETSNANVLNLDWGVLPNECLDCLVEQSEDEPHADFCPRGGNGPTDPLTEEMTRR